MKKLNKIILLTIGIGIGNMSSTAYALQSIIVKNNGSYNSYYSQTDITRISVRDDRISMVIKGDNPFQIEPDPDTGDMFLKLSSLASHQKIYNIFIRTEKHKTYQLHLSPSSKKGVQVQLINLIQLDQDKKEDANDFEIKTPYHNTILQIIRAMYIGTSIKGYKLKDDRYYDERAKKYKYNLEYNIDHDTFARRYILEGKHFVGEMFLCHDAHKDLSAQLLYSVGALATWLVPVSERQNNICFYRVSVNKNE